MKNKYVLPGLLCLALGVYLTSIAISGFTADWESESWKEARGRILESEVYRPERRGPDRSRRAKVAYSYSIEGQQYDGARIFFGTTTGFGARLGVSRTPEKLVRTYPKGKEVVVFYDPTNPTESVLEKGVVRETFQTIPIGVVFFLAGVVAIVRGVLSRSSPAEGQKSL